MVSFLSTMGLIILTWLFFLMVFTGFGLFIRYFLGLKIQSVKSLLLCFWSGWAFTVFLLQLWHLFFRIDQHIVMLISIIGVTGLLLNGKDLWHLIREKLPKYLLFCFTLIVIAVWLSNRAVLPPLNWDSGLYHLNSVRWAGSFPAIPGLGNLHGRLALNSSYFLYVAMLEIGPWARGSYHLANGLLMFAVLSQILLSWFKCFKRGTRLKLYEIYSMILIAPLLKRVMGGNISSPSPDLPVFILGVVLSILFFSFLERSDLSKKGTGYDVFLITALTVVGITIKLSFLALGGMTFLLTLFLWNRRKNAPYGHFDKKIFILLPVVILLGGIPWMIRNIILSGYIAYPLSVGPFPVEWRIPSASVIKMSNYIRGIARTPPGQNAHWNEVLNGWKWLRPWALNMFNLRNFDLLVPLFLIFPGCFLILFFRYVKKLHSSIPKRTWLFLLPPAGAIVCWFFTAPDPRFSYINFWIFGAGLSTIAVSVYPKWQDTIKSYILPFVCILLCLGVFSVVEGKGNFVKTIVSGESFVNSIKKLGINKKFIITPPDEGGTYSLPEVKYRTFTTRSGLVLNVPKNSKRCWDMPLPCTPYPNNKLRLRNNGNMRYGFVIYPRDEKDPMVGINW